MIGTAFLLVLSALFYGAAWRDERCRGEAYSMMKWRLRGRWNV